MGKGKPAKGATHLPSKAAAIYVGVLLSAYLLYPGSAGYVSITVQKWRAYTLISTVFLAVCLFFSIKRKTIGTGKTAPQKTFWRTLTLSQKLILGYWFCTAISTLLSIYPAVSLWGGSRYEGFAAISLYCFSFLLLSRFGTGKPLFLWLLGGILCLECLLCILQLAGYNPLQLYPSGMTYYDANKLYAGEFLGTIGNVDLLSAVLSMAIPALWIALLVLHDKRRFLLSVPLILCLYILLRAFVAAGIVSILGTAVLVPPVLAKEKKWRIRLAMASLGVLVLGLIAVYFLGSQIGGFVAEASALLHGQVDDTFGTGRLYIWRNVLPLVKEHWLFGGGPDTLGLRMTVGFERYSEELGILLQSSIDAAHNEYLNILVNQGLLALLCYLGALGSYAQRWIKAACENQTVAICGGAVLGYCIQAFFGLSSAISTPYLFLALALMEGSLSAENKIITPKKA